MSDNRYPSFIAELVVNAILFFGGIITGCIMANYVAPDFEFATLIGFMMFPIVLYAGLHLWFGTALIIIISGLFCKLAKRIFRIKASSENRKFRSKKTIGDPGAFIFIPTSIVISTGTGLLLSSVSKQLEQPEILQLYILAGTIYGVTCWLAARYGYFPPDINGSDTPGI